MKRSEKRPQPDSDSLSDIIENYSPRLLSYIRSRGVNREDAEDILQDVFYRLARTMQTDGTTIEKISAWLYRVARNSIINLWRKQMEVAMPQIDEASINAACESLSEMLLYSPGSEPDNIYLRKLVWQELEYALAELPPEQSEVFCLTEFDGIPVKEIAANTGIPVATLQSRKHYAVKHLRIRLKGLYDDIMNY